MIAVVDLFAGPGGLGEGFSSITDAEGNGVFQIIMSVENNPFAHKTLRLRSFMRKILTTEGKVPPEYLEFMASQSDDSFMQMTSLHENEWQAAKEEALLETLDKNDDSLAYRAKQRLDELSPEGVVLIGGPPCQAYSLVGRARRTNFSEEEIENDKRQTLYECYLKFIEVIKPDVFIMENVQGILTARHAGYSVFKKITSDMESLGYTVNSLVTENPIVPADYLVCAEQYGIPQARHRVILLGTKSSSNRKPGILVKSNRTVTLGMALSGLPKLRSGFSTRDGTPQDRWTSYLRSEAKALAKEVDDEKVRDRLLSLRQGRFPERQVSSAITRQPNCYKDWYRGRLGTSDIITSHESRTHLSKDLSRYLYCSTYAAVKRCSPTLYDFPSSLIPLHKNAQSLIDSPEKHKTIAFVDRFKVQIDNRPSTTITSHIRKDGHYYIHPDPRQCRSLTVREAARLQTFPDDYFFMGNRTEQYKQVGNAVPPMLAQHIAALVGRYLGHNCKSYIEKKLEL